MQPGRTTVIRLGGDLDVTATRRVLALIDREVAEGTGPVVVDLADVDFVDSSGIGALIYAKESADAAGRPLRLAHVKDRHHRLLRLLGLDGVFEIEPGQG